MGRMLDSFKKGRSRKGPQDPGVPTLHTVWPEEDIESVPGEGESETEEMPFVEVGGPAPVPEDFPPLTPPPAPPEAIVPPAPPMILGPATRWMTVRFQPVSAGEGLTRRSIHFATELIAYHQPKHPISSQYRDLATRMLTQTPAEQPRLLMFTASGAGVGTTTVLLNTAVTLVRDNMRRVVVVDANLRKPALGERLGVTPGLGLKDVLAGLVPLEEAVRATGLPGLSALTVGRTEGITPARLAGESVRALLRQLQDRHDLVLIDAPRWDGSPALVGLGCTCDAVYLCVPEAEQNSDAAVDLLQTIPEQGALLRGCILTSQ